MRFFHGDDVNVFYPSWGMTAYQEAGREHGCYDDDDMGEDEE